MTSVLKLCLLRLKDQGIQAGRLPRGHPIVRQIEKPAVDPLLLIQDAQLGIERLNGEVRLLHRSNRLQRRRQLRHGPLPEADCPLHWLIGRS